VPLVLLLPRAITMVRDARKSDPDIDLAPAAPHTIHE